MTFDDYKRQFEIFAKIDTPGKMAICEKQYQTYLKHKLDSDFFEPIEKTEQDNVRLSGYYKNLYSILSFDKITNNQILFLIQPSFDPEQLLIMEKSGDKYSLKHIALEENFWLMYCGNNTISTAKTIISTGHVKNVIGDQIFPLVEQSISNARMPQSGLFTLDGTTYVLSKVVCGIRRDASKSSPNEGSKTAKIVKLWKTMIGLTAINPTHDCEKEIEALITLILNSQ